MKTQTAYFAAGCFWGIEYYFSQVRGVIKTEVGYMGGDDGNFPNPSYNLVCTGKTGHVETAKVVFDPMKVSFEHLLEKFWDLHDPTAINGQGPDIGTQYSSAIFFENDLQKKAALKSLASHQKKLGSKILTQITFAKKFWKAEEYHQKYAEKRGGASCHF